jgi:hypothetical protein
MLMLRRTINPSGAAAVSGLLQDISEDPRALPEERAAAADWSRRLHHALKQGEPEVITRVLADLAGDNRVPESCRRETRAWVTTLERPQIR